MSQHDLTIANQGFPAFRADLNDALQALGSCQSGTSAPSPTFANQLWYDTTNNILKIRNEDNDAWISIATLDQSADTVSAITAATLNATTVNTGALNTTGNTVLGDASTDTLNVGNGGLVKDASGNVGIGTASPSAPLQIVRNWVSGYGQLALQTTSSSSLAGMNFYDTATRGAGIYQNYSSVNELEINNILAAPIVFSTNNTERMRITGVGNVGIGTASPTSKLHLAVGAATENVIALTGSTTAATYTQCSNTGGSFYIGIDNAAGSSFGSAYSANLYYGGAYPMIFWTNNTERMRIDSAGVVKINTTATNATGVDTKLYVAGVDGVLDLYSASNGASYYCATFRNNNANNGGLQGVIFMNATSVSYNSPSDYRLKDNVAPMTGALDKVKALKPCTFTWKSTGEAGQGFLAHELQEIVPDCVVGEKDEVHADGSIDAQQVDTGFLVATLTAAIKELNAKVDAQSAEIQLLKGAK